MIEATPAAADFVRARGGGVPSGGPGARRPTAANARGRDSDMQL
jgi:hypothetical protein